VLLATLGMLLLAARPAAADPLQVLVPAYFYPIGNPYWGELTIAAGQIRVTAILNPASGPGTMADPNYVQAVNNLRAAGGRVLGYVPTFNGARSEAAVEADINRYIAFYAIDGIFLDQQTTDLAHVGYYADLYNYIKTQNPAYRVIANPGTNTQEAYLSTPTADALVTFEDFGSNYPGYVPDAWTSHYSPDHFAHLLHTVPSAATMAADLKLAAQRNAGLVYVTDDTLANPYDTLPSYWDQEVAQIQATSVPEPAAVWLLATGVLGLLGWRRQATRQTS
jgi:hypothetical protein